MIGIVVVSHSPRLAEATVELALEMVQGVHPPIAIAAGAGNGVIGTDATKVAEAITEVASGDGVIVFMDLGSAVLSAELALELLEDQTVDVRLSPAPFVEGIVAAVVLAAANATLDEVLTETAGALAPKTEHLKPAKEAEDKPSEAHPQTTSIPIQQQPTAPTATALPQTEPFDGPPVISREVTLINPAGLHARPAATFTTTAAGFQAQIMVADLTTGRGPVPAKSLIQILTLGAAQGNNIRLTATGPDAEPAIDALVGLVTQGFGEL